MKISELTLDIIKHHLRIDENYDDVLINAYLDMAKSYVYSYTGLTIEDAETKENLAFAILAIINDFYENRSSTVNSSVKPNKLVESILDMHSTNLL